MKYTFRLAALLFVILAAGPAVLVAETIGGVVRTRGGPGLQGLVRIKLARLGEIVTEQWAGPDGHFRFEQLEAGPYEISAESLGYDKMLTPLTVLGTQLDVVLELRARENMAPRGAAVVSVEDYKVPERARRELDRAVNEQKKGNCIKALEHSKKAIEAFSDYAAAHSLLGECYRRLADIENAKARELAEAAPKK